MQDTFEAEYASISETLKLFGFMVGPYIVGGEFYALRDFCAGVQSALPQSQAERAAVEERLDELLTTCVFNPSYRAFYVGRSMVLPHLRDYSHLLERAVLHYYRADYLSCVLCLLPTVEGVLRSYSGLADPKIHQLIGQLRRGQPTRYPGRHVLYVDALATFLQEWLYIQTWKADFSLSHLNRHYVLHALGTESFYRVIDCHRLFLFFDVFADLLTLEGHEPGYATLPSPGDEPEMDLRRERYMRMIGSSAMQDADEPLLHQHSRYVPEKRPLRLEEVLERFARAMKLP